jgi:glycine dehydrogenase subunit 1
MPYIPHTEEEVADMLTAIGVSSVNELFDEIPEELQSVEFTNICAGSNEMEMLQHAHYLANKNKNGMCFLGAGSYDHHIPAAVWDIASRGEFLTSYTPYQAEASQGTLQLLYEYQTMIAQITGMEVANASMYDGATALAEAILAAVRLKKKATAQRILIPASLHPLYRETVETIVSNQHIEIITLPFDVNTGITPLDALEQYQGKEVTALVIPQPNFFGCIENTPALSNWAHQNDVISIACVNPISLGVLEAPGNWSEHGVDIVCGEGQPFGSPLASGGPYFGFYSTRLSHVRQMPGRLIGRTVDKAGKEGFTLTLQAREQHIRRGKANSNICTNQGLLVTAATIHMSLLGAEGLHRVALASHQKLQTLIQALTSIKGVRLVFNSPHFHEAVIQLPSDVEVVLAELSEKEILGGYALDTHYSTLKNCLLVCATEKRTEEQIAQYASALKQILERK